MSTSSLLLLSILVQAVWSQQFRILCGLSAKCTCYKGTADCRGLQLVKAPVFSHSRSAKIESLDVRNNPDLDCTILKRLEHVLAVTSDCQKTTTKASSADHVSVETVAAVASIVTLACVAVSLALMALCYKMMRKRGPQLPVRQNPARPRRPPKPVVPPPAKASTSKPSNQSTGNKGKSPARGSYIPKRATAATGVSTRSQTMKMMRL